MQYKLDTESQVNIIKEQLFNNLRKKPKIHISKIKIRPSMGILYQLKEHVFWQWRENNKSSSCTSWWYQNHAPQSSESMSATNQDWSRECTWLIKISVQTLKNQNRMKSYQFQTLQKSTKIFLKDWGVYPVNTKSSLLKQYHQQYTLAEKYRLPYMTTETGIWQNWKKAEVICKVEEPTT